MSLLSKRPARPVGSSNRPAYPTGLGVLAVVAVVASAACSPTVSFGGSNGDASGGGASSPTTTYAGGAVECYGPGEPCANDYDCCEAVCGTDGTCTSPPNPAGGIAAPFDPLPDGGVEPPVEDGGVIPPPPPDADVVDPPPVPDAGIEPPVDAAFCLDDGAKCVTDADCCSDSCNGDTCGPPAYGGVAPFSYVELPK